MTTIKDAQRTVDVWVKSHGGYWDPFHNLARLTEEVGEVARAMNTSIGPKRKKAGEGSAEVASELGDVLWVALCLANQLEIDLEAALEQTFDKLGARPHAE
jgi:NTP pyrophosphatase (non-canonical NTP hydrolase)